MSAAPPRCRRLRASSSGGRRRCFVRRVGGPPGDEPLMVGGASLATVSALGAAFAPSFAVIIVTQFFWGVGMSMWMFGREIAAFDMVHRNQRGRQMSALMGIGSTGMAFGPAGGRFLTDLTGVRGLFLVYAGTAAVVLAISLLHKDVSRPRQRGASAPLFDLRAFKEVHPYYRFTYFILFLLHVYAIPRGRR